MSSIRWLAWTDLVASRLIGRLQRDLDALLHACPAGCNSLPNPDGTQMPCPALPVRAACFHSFGGHQQCAPPQSRSHAGPGAAGGPESAAACHRLPGSRRKL